MKRGGIDGDKEGCGCQKSIKMSKSFLLRGKEPLFSFLPLELPKNRKGLLHSLLYMQCGVGRMKKLLREGSREGEIILLSSSMSQETALVMEARPLASSGAPGS